MATTQKRSIPKAVVEKAIVRTTNYKQTFSTPQGKAVLLDLLQEHFILKTTFNGPENDDGRAMAYRDGQRAVVLRIWQTMGLDVSEMYLLMKEGDDVRKTT